ncbi:hypothetical protein BgiMline_034143 [Biomphalaria glabrata]|nr:hypothetical protein BgiMline_020332 [Biomphalaria glabrata]
MRRGKNLLDKNTTKAGHRHDLSLMLDTPIQKPYMGELILLARSAATSNYRLLNGRNKSSDAVACGSSKNESPRK